MTNLISAELFKLRKSFGYKVMLAGVFIYALSDVYISISENDGQASGFVAFFDSIGMWGRCFLICGIFAGLFIAGDFNNRVIQSELAVGNSRLSVMLAKGLVFWIGGIGLTITYQIVNIGGVTIINGFGLGMSKELLICLSVLELTYLFFFSGLMAICVLIAFVFKKIYVVTAMELVLIMFGVQIISSLARMGGILSLIYKSSLFYFIGHLNDFAYQVVTDNNIPSLVVMEPDKAINAFYSNWGDGLLGEMIITIMTIIVLLGITWLSFRKSELK